MTPRFVSATADLSRGTSSVSSHYTQRTKERTKEGRISHVSVFLHFSGFNTMIESSGALILYVRGAPMLLCIK